MLAVNVAKTIKAEENSGAEYNLKLQNQGSGEVDEQNTSGKTVNPKDGR